MPAPRSPLFWLSVSVPGKQGEIGPVGQRWMTGRMKGEAWPPPLRTNRTPPTHRANSRRAKDTPASPPWAGLVHERASGGREVSSRESGLFHSGTRMPPLRPLRDSDSTPVRGLAHQQIHLGSPLSLPFDGLRLGRESAREAKFPADSVATMSRRARQSQGGNTETSHSACATDGHASPEITQRSGEMTCPAGTITSL
jgi:hypothetical protein